MSFLNAIYISLTIETDVELEINATFWKNLFKSYKGIHTLIAMMTFAASASIYLLFGTMYIHFLVVWTNRLNHVIQNTHNVSILKKVLKTHEALQILAQNINLHIYYIVPCLLLVALGLDVGSLYGSIKFIHQRGGFFYPCLGAFLIILQITLLQQASRVHSISQKYISKLNTNEDPFVRRKTKSLRPVTIEVGKTGFIDTSFVLTFMNHVVDKSVIVLLTFR